jgi:cytidylate kinase
MTDMRTESLTESLLTETTLERCRSYIVAQLEGRKGPSITVHDHVPGPAITISRESGCGTHEVVERLADLLQQSGPRQACPWTVFDRQLMEKILEERNLPKELAKYIPEDRRSYLEDVMEELVGLRPPSWEIVPQTIRTILHLVEMGHVIIVGRGCNVITTRTPNVFHVRLIAPLAQRIERVRQSHHLPEKEAAKWVERMDRGRARYVRSHFKCRIDNALLYHVVVNTGRVTYSDAAQLIAESARRFFQREMEILSRNR